MDGVFSAFSQYAASIRDFVVSAMTRYLALGSGLLAMTALTVPELRGSFGVWLNIWLWLSLVYFALDGVVRLNTAGRAGTALRYLGTPAGIIDVLSIVPVPLALGCGVAPESAWLLATLWVLKLTQDS